MHPRVRIKQASCAPSVGRLFFFSGLTLRGSRKAEPCGSLFVSAQKKGEGRIPPPFRRVVCRNRQHDRSFPLGRRTLSEREQANQMMQQQGFHSFPHLEHLKQVRMGKLANHAQSYPVPEFLLPH